MPKFVVLTTVSSIRRYLVEASDRDEAFSYIADGQGNPYAEGDLVEEILTTQSVTEAEATHLIEKYDAHLNIVDYDEEDHS